MRLKIKRKNIGRLASLSALGAGAMALTTGSADASIVHVAVDQTIGGGFGSGSIFVSLPGSSHFLLNAGSFGALHFGTQFGAGYGTLFRARGDPERFSAARCWRRQDSSRSQQVGRYYAVVHSVRARWRAESGLGSMSEAISPKSSHSGTAPDPDAAFPTEGVQVGISRRLRAERSSFSNSSTMAPRSTVGGASRRSQTGWGWK